MSEEKKLSHEAYGGTHGDNYVPYVSASTVMPELTVMSVIFGVIFAIIFAAANTYLGLKIGMTIAAGIPGAILATGILKGILNRNNILEANMISAMASMGESLAGGLIFIIPAIILFGNTLTITTVVTVAILGSILGILFVIPLRRFLVVEEHGKLIYPEGMAAAEVLVSSSAGGKGFVTMMTGLVVGGVFKFFSEGFKFWNFEPEWTLKSYQGTVFGADVTAALLGVGYIVGIEIGMYMFAGALVGWLGLIPLIKFVGGGLTNPLFPATVPIAQMSAWDIWGKYVRYIGAGGVIAGGVISIIKSMPTIVKSFKSAMAGVGEKGTKKRTDTDLPMTYVIGGSIFVFVLAWALPNIKVHFIGAILIIILSFFFSVVSARLVGVIGTSNNPVSGMTISSLLVITASLKAFGYAGKEGMVAAVLAGTVVCVATAIAGGSAQSSKTAFILGGTPKKLQIGMFIGTVFSAAAIGGIILLLNNVYGIGGKEVSAPQATMMSMVVKGIMSGDLPWTLVWVGVALGVMCELMKIPVLPFALGLYLPIHLSAGVVIGGLVRVAVDHKFKKKVIQLKEQTEKGILLCSGLVAGEALIGILIAIFAFMYDQYKIGIFNIGAVGPYILPKVLTEGVFAPWVSTFMMFLLCVWAYKTIVKVDNKLED